MKAITFIGTGNYQPCKYQYNGDECETHLFPVAVSKFFKPSETLVFLTDEARNATAKFFDSKAKTAQEAETDYYKNLENINGGLKLAGKTYFAQLSEINKSCGFAIPKDIPIKSGTSEDEIWTIFDSITSNLDENDEVVFDITHAFRSIPVLSFLIIAFLRETKNIKLKAIVYGAFEAQNKATKETPVFDLTPFIELLDWMSATKQFRQTGNAKFLVELLLNKEFFQLSERINSLSEGLRLLRPTQVMQDSAELANDIETAKSEITNNSKPFAELISTVEQRYSQFSLSDFSKEGERLKKELALTKWYFDNGMLIQALSLLREWISSLVCFRFKLAPFEKSNREIAEKLLSGKKIKINGKDESLKSFGEGKKLIRSWNQIADIRNDLAHAGYRKNPKSYTEIKIKIEEIFTQYIK